jgi:hypothetical protein
LQHTTGLFVLIGGWLCWLCWRWLLDGCWWWCLHMHLHPSGNTSRQQQQPGPR